MSSQDALPNGDERRFPAQTPLPIAVLISGSGTTLRNLIARVQDNGLPVEIRLVISSSVTAKGLQYASDAGIQTLVISPSDRTPEQFSQAIFAACDDAEAAFVVMGGFIKHVLIPPRYDFRVLNIHPSLIPAFCGKGFYGQRVHQAVIDYGCKVSGCTVHFVDNEYDHGPILLQRTVAVKPDDTPTRLAARVFDEEKKAYPDALTALANGRVTSRGRMIRVDEPTG